ncbi:MAG TPA: hypothetical protein VHX88_13850 [Solirubrobacteraceae bacterium]|nr:hypothetical protein [Solirubrobacteraceae bacterium]
MSAASVLLLATPGQASLQNRVAAGQAREQALRARVAAQTTAADDYAGSVASLTARLSEIDGNLRPAQAALASLQGQLSQATAHLNALDGERAVSRAALTAELVHQYEDPPPDIVEVLTEATGFANLLEELTDLRDEERENRQLIEQVRSETGAARSAKHHLAALESHQQVITASVLAEHNEVDQLRESLLERELPHLHARSTAERELAVLEREQAPLERQLAQIEARSAISGAGMTLYGPIPTVYPPFTPHDGPYGFFPAPGTNYTYGEEPTIAAHLDALGRLLHLHLIGISGYRTPAHSVAVGGFADDPHTRGQASDTPGIEGVPQAVLSEFGLWRPFPGAREADHTQLVGSPL